MAAFGDILNELREERGIYQKELAAYLNVSISTVSNYEQNVHQPDSETLCKLADYFGVTTDYLLGRTTYRYDPARLNKSIAAHYTAADLLNSALQLSSRDRTSLLDYLELLTLRAQVSKQH